MRIKYPRTYHLPWSASVTCDDKRLKDTKCFQDKSVIITEKMDGENTTMYNDYYHARSLDGRDHASRSWVKQLHANIQRDIPPGYRVCGENMFAKHSIKYEDLKSYFYCFSIWDESNNCLSWEDTVEFCVLLGIEHVPVLYQPFVWNDVGDSYWLNDYDAIKLDITKQEGYVLRNADSFHYNDFRTNVAKWVRGGHVQHDAKHWQLAEITRNDLIKTEIQ